MLPNPATYSENGSKRRKLCPPAPLSMIRASSAPTEPRGWWIGLTLNINKQSLTLNQNNHNLPSEITATIHDYNSDTQQSQIWMKHNQIYIIDHINLHTNPPPYISVCGNIWENNNVSIPPHNAWIPMKLELGCSVTIIDHNMEGIIDAYDPKSRRYHISYSNQLSEWKWCTNNNTKLCNNNNINFKSFQITPPPFDVTPYGLNEEYIHFSNKMMKQNETMKRTIDTEINIEHQPPLKRKKTASETDEGLHIRIPKMTEKITINDDDEMNTDNREIIDLLSSQSSSPPKRNVIDLRDDDDHEELHVGTAQYREYNRQLMRREKDKRRRNKKERRKYRKSHKGSSKYPRKVKINGIKWKRQYSASDKRYYWMRKNDESITSWNPFQDNGRIAPWLHGKTHWQQWIDKETKKYYYHNPLNNKSTFERPCDYQSPEEISYDSMDDDYKRIQPILNDPNNDNEIELIAISHPKKVKIKKKKKRKLKEKNINIESRRHQQNDPNEGGFSFFDVPTTDNNMNNIKTTEININNNISADLSVLQAVEGLEDILNGNIKDNDSTGSIDVDIDIDNDMDTTEIVSAVWKVLEPKVRAEPKIKFNELISTHAKGWNLNDNVINALLTEYNQTVVDIFQNSMMNNIKNRMEIEENEYNNNNNNNSISEWAQLDENLRSIYGSHNADAIRFVLEIFDGDRDEANIDNEKALKCLSLLSQNSDNLLRIIKSDRRRFIDDFTRILCGMMKYESKTNHIIDVVFKAFNFFVMNEYFYSLINYGKSHTETIFMISSLSKWSIVYQLIASMRITEILTRFNVVKLLKHEDLFQENDVDMSASLLLSIEVLKLIETLTSGITIYKEKKIITKLQRDCIENIQRNGENYMLRTFPLDIIYSVLSSVLTHNLSLSSPNLILFEVCCNILKNVITIGENETILLKILGIECKRSIKYPL